MNIILKRTTALAAAAAMAASLAGCGGAANLQNQISTIEAQVQADANVLCGFIPTAATIAAFIPGFGSAVAEAATIASGICTAVAQAPVVSPSARRASVAAGGLDASFGTARTPNGPVVITGHFTR